MTGLTLPTAHAVRPTAPASLAVAPARLTPVEADRIEQAFPERPAVAQKLYGPGRQVTQAVPLGGRLDLSA